MARITITLPDEIMPDLEEAFRQVYGPDEATGNAYIKGRLIEYAKRTFNSYRVVQAQAAAAGNAQQKAEKDFSAH